MTISIREQREAVEYAVESCRGSAALYRAELRAAALTLAKVERGELVPSSLLREAAKKKPPYPEFCHRPDKCAGLGSCPRDPCCCD